MLSYFVAVIDVGGADWELVLASGSPRRRALLSGVGLSFQIISPEVEELSGNDLTPRELALSNARLKCMAVSLEKREAMVIGADTVVALGGRTFGKPVDLGEAAENLRTFRGRVHEVMTGVVLAHGDHVSEFVGCSYVKFRDFSEEVLTEYLDKVAVLDKAGGYAIQDHGELIVECFEGDYDNIVGLPVGLVLDQLERMGFPVPPRNDE